MMWVYVVEAILEDRCAHGHGERSEISDTEWKPKPRRQQIQCWPAQRDGKKHHSSVGEPLDLLALRRVCVLQPHEHGDHRGDKHHEKGLSRRLGHCCHHAVSEVAGAVTLLSLEIV